MFDARLAPSLDKIEAAHKNIVLRMESVGVEIAALWPSSSQKYSGTRYTTQRA